MNSGASSGEQPENESAAASGSPQSGAAAFAAALAAEIGDDESGKPDESGKVDDEGKPGESRRKVKPESLEAVAQALGIEVSELYSVKVPAGGGREAMTVGQLKDRFTEWDTLEADRLAFTESRVQQEGKLEQAKQELQELFSLVPKDILLNKDTLQKVAARVAARNREQDAQVLVAIPEWKDQAKQESERAEMATMLSAYGLPAAEVKAIKDPRILKFLRDAMRREQQVRAALAKVRPQQRKPANGSPANGAPRLEEPAKPSPLKPTTGRGRFVAELHK